MKLASRSSTSNIEIGWDLPYFNSFLRRLASFSRLILFDRRGNGMSEAVYSAFLAIALYFFVSWYVTTEPRFLIGSGLTLAVLVLTRYGFIVWAFLLCVLIGVALARRHARRPRHAPTSQPGR